MRRLIKPLAVIAAIVCISTANAQEELLRSVMKKNGLKTTEAAAAILIHETLGIKMDWMMIAKTLRSEPFLALCPAFVISKQSGKNLDYVLRHRPKAEGQDWGSVAKEMGMDTSKFNKVNVHGTTFESMVWMNLLNKKFKFKASEYKRLLKDGFKDRHIVLAAVRTQCKPAELKERLALRKANRPKAAGAGGG